MTHLLQHRTPRHVDHAADNDAAGLALGVGIDTVDESRQTHQPRLARPPAPPSERPGIAVLAPVRAGDPCVAVPQDRLASAERRNSLIA